MFHECGFNSRSFYGGRRKYKNALCCSILQLLNCRCSHREQAQSVSDVFVITNGLKPFGSRSPGIMPYVVQGTRTSVNSVGIHQVPFGLESGCGAHRGAATNAGTRILKPWWEVENAYNQNCPGKSL